MAPFSPNASVLKMFDPLQQSSHTSKSDKENYSLDDPLIAQLLRPPQPVAAPVFRKRLVDIGDITMEDAALFINGDDEDDMPFTPLAQRKLNHVPYTTNASSRQPLSDLLGCSSNTPRPSPLTNVTLPTVRVFTPSKNDHTPPSVESSELITEVKQPWRNSSMDDLTVSLAELCMPQAAEAPLLTMQEPLAVPRVIHDSRRDSVDLQSSFFLQANHVESSFDLLKDEIVLHGTEASFGAESEDEAGPSDRLGREAPPLKRASSIASKVSAVKTAMKPKAKRLSLGKPIPEVPPQPKTKPTLPAVARLTNTIRSHAKSSSLVITPAEKKPREMASSSRFLPPSRRATASTQEDSVPAKPTSSSVAALRRVSSIGSKSSRSSLAMPSKPEPHKAGTMRISASKSMPDATAKSSTMTKVQPRPSIATLRRAPSASGPSIAAPRPSRTALPPPPTKTVISRPRSSTISTKTSTLRQRSS